MGIDIDTLVRDNIRQLVPYSSARVEFEGRDEILLDANENSFGSPLDRDYSRYPDPLQTAVRTRIAQLHDVAPSQVFVGNGSDEAIDLLIRVFCRPGVDSITVCPPTYGMYEVAAAINDVGVTEVDLNRDFGLDPDAIAESASIVFLCSPNNPTGNLLDRQSVIEVLERSNGIVVIDEAYFDFSSGESFIPLISRFNNLVVLRTFSKAWGIAGLRVGYAIADECVTRYLSRVKPPYNVNQLSQELIIDAFDRQADVDSAIAMIIEQREMLAERLQTFRSIEQVFPSETNFLLVKTNDADSLYRHFLDHGIVVRNRSTVRGCEGCLRITVGTPEQNEKLLEALALYETSPVY